VATGGARCACVQPGGQRPRSRMPTDAGIGPRTGESPSGAGQAAANSLSQCRLIPQHSEPEADVVRRQLCGPESGCGQRRRRQSQKPGQRPGRSARPDCCWSPAPHRCVPSDDWGDPSFESSADSKAAPDSLVLAASDSYPPITRSGHAANR